MAPSPRPLAVDLFTGLHGWTDGLVSEGFRAVGYDIIDMSEEVGEPKPDHFELVVQDVMTLHGSQFKDAALIVASPPCQAYSYMAMPWTRAKAKAAAIRADETGQALKDLNALFDACFRIQREACEAAGRYVPMVVENVKGAEPWVGRSRWNFGSFHIWGDAPALMPTASKGPMKYGSSTAPRLWKDRDVPRLNDGSIAAGRQHSSKSSARKAASAKIAKIPFALSRHIARTFLPVSEAA